MTYGSYMIVARYHTNNDELYLFVCISFMLHFETVMIIRIKTWKKTMYQDFSICLQFSRWFLRIAIGWGQLQIIRFSTWNHTISIFNFIIIMLILVITIITITIMIINATILGYRAAKVQAMGPPQS